MTCPHLDYRDEDAEHSFDVPRAYCTVVEEFVQPMRADVCNDRYDLDHAEHCEYFLAKAGDDDTTSAGSSADGPGSDATDDAGGEME